MAMIYGQRATEEQQPVRERLRGKQQRAAQLREQLAQKKLQVQSLQLQLKAVGVQDTGFVPGSITAGAGSGPSAPSELRSLLEWIAQSVDLTRQVNFECGASGAGVVVAGRRVLLQKMSAIPLAGTPGAQLQLSIPLELQGDIMHLINSIRGQGGKVGEVELAKIAEAWEMVGAEMCSASTGQQEPAIFLVRREDADCGPQRPPNAEVAGASNSSNSNASNSSNNNNSNSSSDQGSEGSGVDAPPPARAIVVAQWPSIDFAKVAAASIFNADVHFQRLAAAPAKPESNAAAPSPVGVGTMRCPQQLLQQQRQQQQQPAQQPAQHQQQQQQRTQHVVTRTSTIAITRTSSGKQVLTRRTVLQVPAGSSPQRLQVMSKQALPLNSNHQGGPSPGQDQNNGQGQGQGQSQRQAQTALSPSPPRLQKLGFAGGLGATSSTRNQSLASFASCGRSSGSSDDGDDDEDDDDLIVQMGQSQSQSQTLTQNSQETAVDVLPTASGKVAMAEMDVEASMEMADMDLDSDANTHVKATILKRRSRLEHRFALESHTKSNSDKEEAGKTASQEDGSNDENSLSKDKLLQQQQQQPHQEQHHHTQKRPRPEVHSQMVQDQNMSKEKSDGSGEEQQKKRRDHHHHQHHQPQARDPQEDDHSPTTPVLIQQLANVELEQTIVQPIEMAKGNANAALKVRVGDRVIVQYRGRWLSGVLQRVDGDNNVANVKCDGDVAGVITIVALSSVWPSARPTEDATPRTGASPPHRHFFRHARAKTVG